MSLPVVAQSPKSFRVYMKNNKTKHFNAKSQPDLLKDATNKHSQQNIQIGIARMLHSLETQIHKKKTEIIELDNDGQDHKDFHLHIEACEKLEEKREKLNYISRSFAIRQCEQYKMESLKLVQIENMDQNQPKLDLDKYVHKRVSQVIEKQNKIQSRIKIQLQKLGLSKVSSPRNTNIPQIVQQKTSQYIQFTERSSPKSIKSRNLILDEGIQSHRQLGSATKYPKLSIIENRLKNIKLPEGNTIVYQNEANFEQMTNFISLSTGIPAELQKFHHGGRQIANLGDLSDNSTITLFLALQGGKGGFGSLLKNQAQTRRKIINWDQSRDREGRRIGNAKNELNLIEFFRNRKEEEDKIAKENEQVKVIQATIKATEVNVKLDAKYIKQQEQNLEMIEQSFQTAKEKKVTKAESKKSKLSKELLASIDDYLQDEAIKIN